MKTRYTNECYKKCINKKFLIPDILLFKSQEIIANLPIKANCGRPSLKTERMFHGIFYHLKTGIQWNALPKCFGSSSALHRFFQKLSAFSFFKALWTEQIKKYDEVHGLALNVQSVDCAHRKSPLSQEKSGNSPVDRRKKGTKISVLAEKNGIPLGLALGPSNQHDSQLFYETIKSIPKEIIMPYYKEMHLDAAYDTEDVKTALFNCYYVPKIAPNRRNSKTRPKNPIGYTRWFIEPVHSWMNRFRAILIRFSKRATNYLSMAHFAAAIIIFRKT